MKLYNYLNKRLEDFRPLHKDYVGLYLCGPTVYGDPHLGHARSAITFDLLYRYLEYKGYRVRYVRNITDVGHLEDEVRESGEDKIEKAARLGRVEPMEIAHMYAMRYKNAMEVLNVRTPSIEPLASGHILEQQEYIAKLIEKKLAYCVNGNVYFDVKSFASADASAGSGSAGIGAADIYGKLSGKKIDDLLAGQRALKNQDEKKSEMDFALWKKVPDNQIMHWSSPWSKRGVPGWHTECCVMSEKYLGHPFDIHGGGIDLQFPHHEAEIAQAYGLHGQVPANYWVYNNMVTIDKKKMSKSLNNFITLEMFFTGNHERLTQAYSPNVLRFFLLRAHYRSLIDVSDEALQGAAKGIVKLEKALQKSKKILVAHVAANGGDEEKIIRDYKLAGTGARAEKIFAELNGHMDKDMDTPQVIASLFELAGLLDAVDVGVGAGDRKIGAEIAMSAVDGGAYSQEEVSFAYVFYVFYAEILGLDTIANAAYARPSHTLKNTGGFVYGHSPLTSTTYMNADATKSDVLEDEKLIAGLVDHILAQRKKAREDKNYALSDELRDKLHALGIIIKDHPDGSCTWEQKEGSCP